MNPQDWERLDSLFAQAADLPAPDRARFLDGLSSSDPHLARELASLLDYDSAGEGSLRNIVDRLVADAPLIPQWSGQAFGSYRVVRTIATGGMGTVFEAVREQDYRKHVALKVAASPIGTPAWAERFQQERQILAGLDHPHIARFLDGGASSDGLPYFAMELVEGQPITDFVRQRKASLHRRIELFRKVCAAVSYAHQSLIVHRDLKPGNILVTADGEPKLLDFGLAKLLSPLQPELNLTQTAMPLLTPAYCSPEQVSGGKITTRVDVYQLGLILFELLVDEQAHQLGGSSPADLERAVLQAEPPVPSARAAAAGKRTLAKSLRGDLDTIVAKAVEKDPERRYPSVDLLSEDLARYLDGRPILARRAGWRYRAGKFVRRHWVPVTAGVAVVVALIAGALAFAWQARIAERRFDLARKLANALLFDIHDKVQLMPGAVALRKQISSTAVEYLDALSKEAGRNYALRRELAAGYLRLANAQWSAGETRMQAGRTDSTLGSLNRAVGLLEGMPASELALASGTEARIRQRRGQILAWAWNLEAARADLERAIALSPCTMQRTELCQNRIAALSFLLSTHIPLRNWPACDGDLTDMERSTEAYRVAGGETAYRANSLEVGYGRMRVLSVQHKNAQRVAIGRRLLPLAEGVSPQALLEGSTLHAVASFYGLFAKALRDAGEGSTRERIELLRKALEYASRVQVDSGDMVALSLVAQIKNDMALDSESLDPDEASRLYRQSVDALMQRWEIVENTLSTRLDLYLAGDRAIRFSAKTGRLKDAVEFARRISAVISPAMFLKLNLARSKEVQQSQALWWAASVATEEKARLAEQLWRDALAAVEAGLLQTPDDAMAQVSAALVFDGWADWLRQAGRPGDDYQERAHSLWAQLSTAYPDNEFIRDRSNGKRPQHGEQ